jgi:hypothetical protein
MGTASSTGNYDFTFYGDIRSLPNAVPWMKWDASAGNLLCNDVLIKISGTTGGLETDDIRLFNSSYQSGVSIAAIGLTSSGDISIKENIITKKSVILQDANGESMELKPGTGIFEKGSDKGKIKLGDTSVTLQKGSDTLLEVKDDGSFALSPQGTAPDVNTSSDGDMYVDDDGNLNIFQT